MCNCSSSLLPITLLTDNLSENYCLGKSQKSIEYKMIESKPSISMQWSVLFQNVVFFRGKRDIWAFHVHVEYNWTT